MWEKAGLYLMLSSWPAAWRNALLIFCFCIFPNLVFFVCAKWLGIDRPAINLDYAFVVVLFALSFRLLAGFFLFLFLIIDVLSLLGQVMPFVRIFDVLYLLKFSLLASGLHVLLILSIIISVSIIWLLVFLAGKRASIMFALCVFNALILLKLIGGEVVTKDKVRLHRLSGYSFVDSQSLLFWRSRGALFFSVFSGGSAGLKPLSTAGASAPLWESLNTGNLARRILLVVVESWGATKDRRIQDAILSPLYRARMESLEFGEVRQSGYTLAGELRELCRMYPESYNLLQVTEGFDSCLPNQLGRMGYETLAMHGAASVMYDRHNWYPKAGFSHSIFFENRIWPARCYSFPGACDLDMLKEVKTFFSKNGSLFFYWLTLNTHAPYDLRDLRYDVFDCSRFDIAEASESCRNFKLQAQFFDGVAKLLSSSKMKGVEFVIVGDHAPVHLDVGEKHAVFYEGVVPFVRGKTLSE
ncbi:hypothetical protein SAMN05216601_101230 [Ectopseudomonas composti]|uniref:Sulfatase N-terminal domain-containing protein n=1 Tax=Ectopseudomonas composti TaxID=658457 RepID=A0A1I5JBW7_9GAMM|nr:sulfatase-like hydrolase/transferase [Pseudomonas composti]SFO70364.1 hypothetical protein SAMN05216601_101230 [Pseudomonas composti]